MLDPRIGWVPLIVKGNGLARMRDEDRVAVAAEQVVAVSAMPEGWLR